MAGNRGVESWRSRQFINDRQSSNMRGSCVKWRLGTFYAKSKRLRFRQIWEEARQYRDRQYSDYRKSRHHGHRNRFLCPTPNMLLAQRSDGESDVEEGTWRNWNAYRTKWNDPNHSKFTMEYALTKSHHCKEEWSINTKKWRTKCRWPRPPQPQPYNFIASLSHLFFEARRHLVGNFDDTCEQVPYGDGELLAG